ncbi:uncharacterized protein LOC122251379 [Penaeus japonicus]|uniref:uncharacterized protein LOC122251379 n=1 Tax=Penaeus japonicus TaxID=27405 RepID=UPI001C7108A6|nr:uncharacterized protein LOC122251379 [Penaeus japonicus]
MSSLVSNASWFHSSELSEQSLAFYTANLISIKILCRSQVQRRQRPGSNTLLKQHEDLSSNLNVVHVQKDLVNHISSVVEGQPIVHKIEYMATDWNDRPLKDVRIAKSGRRPVKTPYYISDDPYNLKDWLKTISVPLGLSFCIIYVFNYFIKMLDRSIIPDDGSMEIDEATEDEAKEGGQAKKDEEKEDGEKKEQERKALPEKDEGTGVRRRKPTEKE